MLLLSKTIFLFLSQLNYSAYSRKKTARREIRISSAILQPLHNMLFSKMYFIPCKKENRDSFCIKARCRKERWRIWRDRNRERGRGRGRDRERQKWIKNTIFRCKCNYFTSQCDLGLRGGKNYIHTGCRFAKPQCVLFYSEFFTFCLAEYVSPQMVTKVHKFYST